MERKTKDEKNLKKAKKLDSKTNRKYSSRGQMKRRIKNSKTISNVKEIGDDGLIYLKSGEVATLIEVKAIDEDLTELDKWIYCELNNAAKSVREALDNYRYNDASAAIYEFFWNEF